MKKKLLVGGGITALVVAIVAIVVFAQGGNYFQGNASVPNMNDVRIDKISSSKITPKNVELGSNTLDSTALNDNSASRVPTATVETVETVKPVIKRTPGASEVPGYNPLPDDESTVESPMKSVKKTPAETPKTPAETPKTPAETPKTPAETPKTPAETPKTPAETPKKDICSNIEGAQTKVPSGYVVNDKGVCSVLEAKKTTETPKDTYIPKKSEGVGCGQWTDVSSKDDEYDIWMYLCDKGIVKGNSDGTLRPESELNRADLLALAFRASNYENIYNVNDNVSNCFPDVRNEWFAKYMCTARNKGFIQGYTDGTAKPAKNVILAEGLKMYLGALGKSYNVSTSNCWYCNMVKNAGADNYLPYSLHNNSEQIGSIELTRRKAFNMLYRIMIYK